MGLDPHNTLHQHVVHILIALYTKGMEIWGQDWTVDHLISLDWISKGSRLSMLEADMSALKTDVASMRTDMNKGFELILQALKSAET